MRADKFSYPSRSKANLSRKPTKSLLDDIPPFPVSYHHPVSLKDLQFPHGKFAIAILGSGSYHSNNRT
jgi:hypothetical protein